LDWTLKIGGAAGQGLQVIGTVVTRAFVRAGLYVFAVQDNESRIRGGHNFVQLRVSDKPVNAMSAHVDVLVALDAATVQEHLAELREDGIVVRDPAVIADAAVGDKGFDVPLEKLTADAGGQKIMENSTAVGAVLGIVRFPIERLAPLFEQEFSPKGRAVVDANLKVAQAGYDYAVANCTRCKLTIKPQEQPSQMILSGHQAVALGAMAAGLRFMSAYPMSPSTTITEFLAQQAIEYGIVVEQAEDEIAAINLAIGAGYAGARAMTATSGGGFSLMVEGVGLAGVTETPVVIVDAQRPGPGTGLPTRTEQGDLLFVIHSAQGEFPRAVLAPGDAEQAFHLTAKAFNLAEKYQMPVFILTDQYLADSIWTTPPLDLSRIVVERGELLAAGAPADYRRYEVTESGISPRAIPGAGAALVVADSDEHTDEGHITESAAVRNDMVAKRMRKLELARAEIAPPEAYGPKKSKVTLISWGSNRHVVHETVDILNAAHPDSANSLHFTELWPFPMEVVLQLFKDAGQLIAMENNATAQFAHLIRSETGIHIEKSILKFDGRPFIPEHLADAVRKEMSY
jgi:2-oxoglutarate/2-oxoacid ferredoxin oxidoreductase subunit alpha